MTANDSQVSIDDDTEILALEKLLSECDKTEESVKVPPRLREDSSFLEAFGNVGTPKTTKEASAAAEELDSSDDEGIKNFLEQKYNQYGSDINKKLKQQRESQHESRVTNEVNASIKQNLSSNTQPLNSLHIKNPHNPVQRQSYIKDSSKKNADIPSSSFTQPSRTAAPVSQQQSVATIYTDPVFGLRIINPLVSSALLIERMAGRKPIPFAAVPLHIQSGDLSKDWVIAGAVVSKGNIRKTKTGSLFSIWRLSDLRGEIKTISLFLFKSAHKDLWKTAEGMCIAVLNPTIFEKRADSADVACLSIDTPQKVMVLGESKDFGVCRALKKNGDKCTAIVNLKECDTCVFHLKQEFSKSSRRSELQSATAGRGLNELRNKVLGKSEVFYGGQSFSAVPAKKSAKLIKKDSARLSTLSEYAVSPFAGSINHTSKPKGLFATAVPYAKPEGFVSKVAANVEVSGKQRQKDIERLKCLQEESAKFSNAAEKRDENVSSKISTATSISSISKNSITTTPSTSSAAKKFGLSNSLVNTSFSPQLSSKNFNIEVSLSNISKAKAAEAAKFRALQKIKQSPIEKVNPNSVRGTTSGKRRAIDELNEKFQSNDAKRQKMEEERKEEDRKSRIQRIMDATSSHKNLIDMRELEEQEHYFNKLERKEALEEKMLSTYKVPCKAVYCRQCKYTAFSAADRCKEERHTLKVIEAVKRFFQCEDCGNRTATVFKLPNESCKTCKGSRWKRSAMIREKKVCDGTEGLSVRGDEETFIGSLAGKANLNLLVPDE